MKRALTTLLALIIFASATALADTQTILIAAAASLEYAFTQQLIPMFQAQYPNIHVEGAYDSSGKLQTQIVEGLQADLFMSAAMKQMDALSDLGLVSNSTIVRLLENKIVLIAPTGSDTAIASFEQLINAGAIALGDPDSVPVGQYARDALTALGIWDAALAKASLGTNVTEVLNWVAEGSADVGIVYATDAATTNKVKVLCEAPSGILASQVIYPVGIVAATKHPESAQLFLDFLRADGALAVFESYGFAAVK